jgi:trigger factor
MDVKVADAGPCRKQVTVWAPADSIAGDYREVLGAVGKVARIPGFRLGKASLPIVEKRYAAEIRQETRDRLVPRLYRQALEQEGIKPVAIVGVENVDFDKAKGLGFRVTVDVAPDFRLPKYKNIPLKVLPVTVDDARVDEAIGNLRNRFGRFEPVTGRPARDGDLVRVDYRATCDGQALVELVPDNRAIGEATDFIMHIAEPEFLPGFNEGLKGAALDEQREIVVTFPENHPVKAVAGRRANYAVTVKEIRERVPAALDAGFFQRFGVEDETGLKERVRNGLREEGEQAEAARQRDEIARFLLAKTRFELPQSVVEEETRMTVRHMVNDIVRRGGTREQIVGQQDRIVGAATDASTGRVRLTYILLRIADEVGIAVTDADVAERIAAMARRYQMKPEQLRAELEKRDGIERLTTDLRADKAMSWLVDAARQK